MAVVARNRSSIVSSGKRFCLIGNGQTVLGAHLGSSAMGNSGCFSGDRAAGA
jgi:hypothetical protein